MCHKVSAFFLRLILACTLQAADADDLRKNVVVLVDSSKSVDATNRDSALRLVAGLVSGRVEETTRSNWEFKPAPAADYPVATVNLQRLIQGASEPTQPIARDTARVVINPLGNYARVADLRARLGQARTSTPAEISQLLLTPDPPFESTDNSTHIRLAEAAVAKSFLVASSEQPYYLLVISDFHEDCFNKPIADYLDKTKNTALKVQNQKVFRGEIAFNDGSGADNRKYSGDDVESISFLEQKTSDLFLGEFIYKGVPMPQAPVNVKVYSPMVKRGMKFTEQSRTVTWILPDPAPDFVIEQEGMEPDTTLEVRIVNTADQSQRVIKETCDLVLARNNRLELGSLMERPELTNFMVPGNFEITLSIPQGIGIQVNANATLEVLVPVISFADSNLEKSTADRPFDFALNTEIRDKRISLRLDPPPSKAHQVEVSLGDNAIQVEVSGGSGEGVLGDLLDKAAGEDSLKLTASLDLPPIGNTATKDAWIHLPEISLWAVYEGRMAEEESITLKNARAITLKASHVGMEGMDWRGTTIVSMADQQQVQMSTDDDNNLDFSELPPGRYNVVAKFGSAKNPVKKEVFVVVPKSTPWMLFALIGMVVASLGLFSWHFFRR